MLTFLLSSFRIFPINSHSYWDHLTLITLSLNFLSASPKGLRLIVFASFSFTRIILSSILPFLVTSVLSQSLISVPPSHFSIKCLFLLPFLFVSLLSLSNFFSCTHVPFFFLCFLLSPSLFFLSLFPPLSVMKPVII